MKNVYKQLENQRQKKEYLFAYLELGSFKSSLSVCQLKKKDNTRVGAIAQWYYISLTGIGPWVQYTHTHTRTHTGVHTPVLQIWYGNSSCQSISQSVLPATA